LVFPEAALPVAEEMYDVVSLPLSSELPEEQNLS
jgi:hypothetical protein